jgi:hypothetical protein
MGVRARKSRRPYGLRWVTKGWATWCNQTQRQATEGRALSKGWYELRWYERVNVICRQEGRHCSVARQEIEYGSGRRASKVYRAIGDNVRSVDLRKYRTSTGV